MPDDRTRAKMPVMGRPKEEVQRLLATLPDEASFEDIHYHIYVQQAIRRGREAAQRGELPDEEEVAKRMSKWLGE
jgi:predicted transcriptional regulator